MRRHTFYRLAGGKGEMFLTRDRGACCDGGMTNTVLPTGWLAERVERAFVAVTNLRASLWWPGSMWGYEHVARWIRNVALHQPDHPGLAEAVEKLVSLVEAGKVFADYPKHGLAAYNEEEVVAGLLAHYRVFGDQRVLAAARQLGASMATNHPRLAGNHYYKSLAIGPLCDLAEATGDDAFLAAAVAIARKILVLMWTLVRKDEPYKSREPAAA